MSETCHQTLADDPNIKIIIAGYINHLNIKELRWPRRAMQQLVMAPTRGDRILDVLLTNGPFLWKKEQYTKDL
ncbi:unnamed protein product [Porites evermanni]|uniref:Uncharacterized protein n=1 Tax=Porites evermanni TaxID=104178 RepID=A0ABN8MN24_9CNID|nr:unnamed protein product [Porites evermanni]